MCLGAHNEFGAEDEQLTTGARQRARATGAVRCPCPPSMSDSTRSTPAPSVAFPTPIPMTAESDARFHVIWFQDVQMTASGTFEPEGAAP